MTAIVDTNVLVYRFDPRFPAKQRRAIEVLRRGLADDSIRVPHQALVEFVAVVTRRRGSEPPLLAEADAWREAEELLATFGMLYPTESLVRTALRAAATYRLSWFDAHLFAYAEEYEIDEILSEDFQDGRLYGRVRIRDPFR